MVYDPNKWRSQIKPGDRLVPDPAWNSSAKTESAKLPLTAQVLGVVYKAKSLSGIMYRVATVSGDEKLLDASWFYPPKLDGNGDIARHG